MNNLRVSACWIVTLTLCACVPLVPREQLDLPVAHARPDAEQAVDRTRRAFTQAAQANDVQAMASFFTADGMVITAEGDTVRGREALSQFLATNRAIPTLAVMHFGQFSREFHLQQCTDGVNERGRFHTRHPGGAPADTFSGVYAVRWHWGSGGGAEIQRMTFVARSAVRRLAPSGCYVPLVVQQESKRLVLNLFGVAGLGGGPQAGVESAMREEDWHGGGSLNYMCPSWTICQGHTTPWTHSETPAPPSGALGIVTYRITPAVATEVMVGAWPKGSTIGLDSAGTAQLEAMWSGYFVGTVLTYGRSGFQIGLGPALHHTTWHLVRANPYNLSLRSEENPKVNSLGVVVELGYHRALLGPFLLDARAQLRGFSKTTLPGGTTYLNAPIANNSSFIGLGVGAAF